MLSTGGLRLTKHHGAGNDFLVMLDPDGQRSLSCEEARVLCDRHRGIGADGILRVMSGSDGAALTMELRNADGGTAEMSGNGIRCLVQAAVDAGWVKPGPVSVATGGGLRIVEYRAAEGPGLGHARVDMGPVTLGPELAADIAPDVRGVRHARTVDIGNPHIVLFADAVDDTTVATVGPRLEHFVASRANVEFVWPGATSDELTMRVWERGAGLTPACGTGACAALVAAARRGLTGPKAEIVCDGGPLEIEWRDDGHVIMTGPVAVSFTGMLELVA